MKRLLTLWLTLLATFWLVRSLLGALAGGSPEPSLAELLAVALVPALQALALAWLTRAPGPSPALALARAVRHSRLLGALLLLDLAAPALPLAYPSQIWLTPALGDALDGNPTSILAAAQALGAGLLFLRPALLQSGLPRRSRLRLAAFAATLAVLAALLAVDALTLAGEGLLPEGSPLLWRLCLHAPALALALAQLFSVQEALRACRAPEQAATAPAVGGPGAATALGAAAACAWLAFLLAITAALFESSPPIPLGGPVAVCALLGTTALVAAGLPAPEKGFRRSGV